MKKVSKLILMLVGLLIIKGRVFALSAEIKVDKSEVHVGDNIIVSIDMKGTAVWNIHVAADGPVTCDDTEYCNFSENKCVFNESDAEANARNIDKAFTNTCRATGEGTISFFFKDDNDITSTEEETIELSGSKEVTVTAAPSTPTDSGTTTKTKYTITYDSNGGSTCSTSSKTVTKGSKLGTLCKPSKKGYTFSGWYTEVSGGTKVTKNTKATKDMTIYAHWTKKVTNAKTGITTPIIGLLAITIISLIGLLTVRNKKTTLE